MQKKIFFLGLLVCVFVRAGEEGKRDEKIKKMCETIIIIQREAAKGSKYQPYPTAWQDLEYSNNDPKHVVTNYSSKRVLGHLGLLEHDCTITELARKAYKLCIAT